MVIHTVILNFGGMVSWHLVTIEEFPGERNMFSKVISKILMGRTDKYRNVQWMHKIYYLIFVTHDF